MDHVSRLRRECTVLLSQAASLLKTAMRLRLPCKSFIMRQGTFMCVLPWLGSVSPPPPLTVVRFLCLRSLGGANQINAK